MGNFARVFKRQLAWVVIPVFSLSMGVCAAQAEQAGARDSAENPNRHIAVWDPPAAFVVNESGRSHQAETGSLECPRFVFRNGFEPGRLDGIFRTDFELPPESAGAFIRYTTAAGFIVHVDKHTITIQDPWAMNSVQQWGDPHENLNGKHIKDWGGLAGWDGSRRTILIAGGAKVTMEAAGPTGVVLLTSIYDGQQNLQIDNTTNTILHHGMTGADTHARESAQYDGETARFSVDPATAIALYDTIYNEDQDFNKVMSDVPLGSTGGCANPGMVNDYFP